MEEYRASTSNAGAEDISYAKLPYPIPFKTADHQADHSAPTLPTGPVHHKSPVEVGGQAAFDFISSYDLPPSGHVDNALGAATAAAYGGSAAPSAAAHTTHAKAPPASAVEALREILNKNIPYTDTSADQYNHQPLDVQYSDQGYSEYNQQQQQISQIQHDTLDNYGGPGSSGSAGFQTPQHHHVPSATANDHHHEPLGADFNSVQQYEIPPDPRTYVPPFKPLTGKVVAAPHYGRYGAPMPAAIALGGAYGMPLQSVYQAHSIHTAYGPPSKFIRPAGTNSFIGAPPPPAHGHGIGGISGGGHKGPYHLGGGGQGNTHTYLPPQMPWSNGPQKRTSINHPLDKMHAKRSNGLNRGNFGQGFAAAAASLPGPVRIPAGGGSPARGSPAAVADNEPLLAYQSKQLQDSLGLDIEIQKSIGIELDASGKPKQLAHPPSDPSPIRRNSVADDDTLRPPPVTGPVYSRPYSHYRRLTPKKYTFHRY